MNLPIIIMKGTWLYLDISAIMFVKDQSYPLTSGLFFCSNSKCKKEPFTKTGVATVGKKKSL